MPKPTEDKDGAERAAEPGTEPSTGDGGTGTGTAETEELEPDRDVGAGPEAETPADAAPEEAGAPGETTAGEGDGPVPEPEEGADRTGEAGAADEPPPAAEAEAPEPEAQDRAAEATDTAETPARAASAPADPAPRGGTGAAILAGLIGAVVGFGGSILALGGGLVQIPPDPAVAALRGDLSDLSRNAEATAEQLATLSGAVETAGQRLETVEAAASEAAAAAANVPVPDLGPIDAGLAALSDRLDALDTRLTELEKRPVEGGAASASALEAFDREMAEMRAALEAARTGAAETEARIAALVAEAEARFAGLAGAAEGRIKAEVARAESLVAEREAQALAEAEAAAREAADLRARAAQSALSAALSADRPIVPALEELAAAGVELPADLSGIAEPPSQAELEAAFPDAARRALATALRDDAGDESLGDRALAFLRAQSGARSLTPRAGDDADAILSRAEAALREADLDGALTEIAALPDPVRAEMAEWVERAEARRAVADAVAALAAPAR
ncbi:MAG: hypothetical protein NXH83_06550 [Rhodobacteraceae bacterium]|nr:hypothetical protein [Paracoccaceae bacterium]